MREALIVWGGWSGHEPEKGAHIVAGMLEEHGFKVYIENTTEAFADPAIADMSLIVPIVTMSKIEKEEVENLTAAVRGGVGLAGYHGGMCDAFRDSVDYQFMCGGQWVAHPGNIIDYRVDIAKPDDPIMQGISSFPYRSEQYYMHVDPSNEVLATTTFSGEHAPWIEGVVMPVVWKRQARRGPRVLSARSAMSRANSQCRRCARFSSAACYGRRASADCNQIDAAHGCSRNSESGFPPPLWGRVRVGGRAGPFSMAAQGAFARRIFSAASSRCLASATPHAGPPHIGRAEGRPSLEGLWGAGAQAASTSSVARARQ